ncbi:protein adenylyltransferase SelO [Persicobacter psychrovividus]|uniref:Protein nucleotidyltransferase YdiU n=1 Tax=Persicobacter psychrovividus TaxID=387638 RepID=A0ABN6LD38_9BACT|nr:UPF0061 protein [Persicobacter psychrovividus]
MPTTDHKFHLENTYKNLPASFYSFQSPVPVAAPKTVLYNEKLADTLGLNFQTSIAEYLSGNQLIAGAQPLAQAYAGHQFGHFTMLGDGRAILLGEQVTPDQKRVDIQLKGAGRTPYSRQGDGRATLYSMLREYLISEAMHHLGIPTTRSLAVVATGEKVFRGEHHDGAILTRVAGSHLRVGTFEYARNVRTLEELQALIDYTIDRHYPDLKNAENPTLGLLETVMDQQIDLIVDWMRVGFIHGVMNTDNMSIAGETIDYGPCAFMNAYDPKTVFSSIDTQGRYAYGNQPNIALWNIVAFANALLPLIADDEDQSIEKAQKVIDGFKAKFSQKWTQMMFGKLGLRQVEDKDKSLVDRLLALMEKYKADYTQTFLALHEDRDLDTPLFQAEDFKQWKEDWHRFSPDKSWMKKYNPNIIPRNHWVENALNSAVEGDMQPFNELMERLSQPYGEHPEGVRFEVMDGGIDSGYQTFCGT